MGDLYEFPVFLESRGPLPAEHRRKIENYFRVHRRSGGGECGSLRRLHGDVYSIAFRRLKDQQAVLQKSLHRLNLGDDVLEITVRSSPDPESSTGLIQTTTDPPQTKQQEQTLPASTPPSSGEQCEAQNPEQLLQDAISTGDTRGGKVQVQVLQGTIETQQVDAIVSPMVGYDPLSTRVGNILFSLVKGQLTARYRAEAGEETMPGDAVVVEGFPALPSEAVIFLSLAPWDNDPSGTAVEVLRLAVYNMLTSCENRGFGSVAMPVLGVGIALGFPASVVAWVLQEEVQKFEQDRVIRTPLQVHVIIHHDDHESREAFECFQEPLKLSEDLYQPDPETRRIVLLGKTGTGKSSLANTIFGEPLFETNHSPNSGTKKCHVEIKRVHGRSITLIDTPGFFDVGRTEREVKPEIMSCITECAPGPHAFLILLKVDKFTEQEKEVIRKIGECFTPEALKYAVVVFTHGEQLDDGTSIEQFVSQNEDLRALVDQCGGRCNVFDNKYWNNEDDAYRNNRLHVEQLLATVDRMVAENGGGCYTNAMLQAVEQEIQKEAVHITQSSGSGTVAVAAADVRRQAQRSVSNRLLIQLAGVSTGALLGALCGLAAMVGLVIGAGRQCSAFLNIVKQVPALRGAAGGAGAGGVAAGMAAAAAVVAVGGGVTGGVIGYETAEEAGSVKEAVEMTAQAMMDRGRVLIDKGQAALK